MNPTRNRGHPAAGGIGHGVEKAGDILTMYMGPHDLLVNMGVCFIAGTTAEEMHEAIRHIEADLQKAYPETNRVYIEAESLPVSGEELGVCSPREPQ
jgi:divalent metal cation (Fe/Co/Zn/Cd) transporter